MTNQCKVPQVAPIGTQRRIGSDSVWPLRRADGKTWAEARKEREAKA
jgi:hypothetical protein